MLWCQAVFAVMLALNPSQGPDESVANIPSITAEITIGKAIQVKRMHEPVFRNVICDFKIKPTSSTPGSAILAGKVVDNNAGTGQAFVPVFVGSTLHHPRLAALTNADGEFRFRVWIVDQDELKRANKPLLKVKGKLLAEYGRWLESTAIDDVTLYLGGDFDSNAEMVSIRTHIHSLRQFLKRNMPKKP